MEIFPCLPRSIRILILLWNKIKVQKKLKLKCLIDILYVVIYSLLTSSLFDWCYFNIMFSHFDGYIGNKSKNLVILGLNLTIAI